MLVKGKFLFGVNIYVKSCLKIIFGLFWVVDLKRVLVNFLN